MVEEEDCMKEGEMRGVVEEGERVVERMNSDSGKIGKDQEVVRDEYLRQ